jgi:6-phosphogluconate dehydrogenase
MDLAMIGLGRMGGNMTLRLLRGGHRVVAYARHEEQIRAFAAKGAVGVTGLPELAAALPRPRVVWMMIPAGDPVDRTIEALLPHLDTSDLLIDGGNSYFKDSIRRAQALAGRGIRYLDVGTSGGIWGLENGYCMMAGGDPADFDRVRPLLETLAPKDGYLLAGGPGAGHFTKMVHNGIEYGMLQAYAEGFEILRKSGYDLDLERLSHLWNQGSVVRSWLLELLERAFAKDPGLAGIRGYVEDSGEGRWTVLAAIEEDVPAPVIAESLFARFRSRQDESFGAKVIAALRNEFGGHAVLREPAAGEGERPGAPGKKG